MRREIKNLEHVELDALAQAYFFAIPGMTEDGIEIGKQYVTGKPIRFIRMIYDVQDIKEKRCYLQNEKLFVDGECFHCDEFVQLDGEKLQSICIYMVTIDEVESTGDLLDDYYLHAWKTSCLDAAREKIKIMLFDEMRTDLTKRNKIEVSNSYGPGFYGMDIVELKRFCEILDGNEIGVSMSGQMLYPIQTCTGIYFAMEQGGIKKKAPCEVCIIDGSCNLCSYRKRANDKLKLS